ncbi:MAG: hypothetical protein M0P94_05175 [Candidatus Absconditabacterales bacterium]|nr:hypothetical protein [Candidatus Absconditabacterales bacterium]
MINRKLLCRHKKTLEFFIFDSLGVPVNLEGKTVKFILNDEKNNEDPEIIKDCVITDLEQGKCEITLSSEETNIPAGRYFAQLSIIDSQNEAEATVLENDFQGIFLFEESLL